MRIIFLGDVVGAPGRAALARHLPALRQQYQPAAVIANGENACNGRGITTATAQEIFAVGVDVITLGDHTFDQKGVEELLAQHPRVIRPANYPPGTVGRGHTVFTNAGGQRIGVINLQGRVFLPQLVDCPFQAAQRLRPEYLLGEQVDALVVDMHAEATSEKAAMAHLWDGHATLVVGTHTHIPTADTRVQPGGTAFQSDAGMCGDYQSSLGMTLASVMPGFTQRARSRFEPSTGEATLCGVMVEVGGNGLAVSATPLRVGGVLAPAP